MNRLAFSIAVTFLMLLWGAVCIPVLMLLEPESICDAAGIVRDVVLDVWSWTGEYSQ